MAKLIAFYGINNIGKTTQVGIICEKLKTLGKKVRPVKYPIYELEPTGPFLNSMLRSNKNLSISESELQMWFALNRFQFQPQLNKILAENDFVILEDYIGTGIAWGMAKGVDRVWLEAVNQPLLQPDTVILMDGSRSMSAKEKNHLHEMEDELVERCRKIYLQLAAGHHWHIVETSSDWDITTSRIWKIIENEYGL